MGGVMGRKHTVEITQNGVNKERERFYRKNVEFFRLIEKIKLWPARSGALHGVKTVELNGNTARITTHCGDNFLVRNSRHSRAARWLRNKWCACACKDCKIPEWKLAKYSKTTMSNRWGSSLN